MIITEHHLLSCFKCRFSLWFPRETRKNCRSKKYTTGGKGEKKKLFMFHPQLNFLLRKFSFLLALLSGGFPYWEYAHSLDIKQFFFLILHKVEIHEGGWWQWIDSLVAWIITKTVREFLRDLKSWDLQCGGLSWAERLCEEDWWSLFFW